MRRHKCYARSRANPGRRHRFPNSRASPAATKGTAAPVRKCSRWGPNPPKPRLKNQTAIVIGQPTPRLAPDEDPVAEERIKSPASELERIPAEPNSIRPPAVSVSGDAVPSTECVKVTESGSVVINS